MRGKREEVSEVGRRWVVEEVAAVESEERELLRRRVVMEEDVDEDSGGSSSLCWMYGIAMTFWILREWTAYQNIPQWPLLVKICERAAVKQNRLGRSLEKKGRDDDEQMVRNNW